MNSGNNINYYFYKVSFGFLFAVALLGILLRSTPFISLPLPYLNILHAHSHTALLGWAFVMSCYGITTLYNINYKQYKNHLILLYVSIIGMLISFLYQSYGAISIGFSTLFMLTAYIIVYNVYKRLPKSWIGRILKRSIVWFYISTLGIWVLGPTSALLGKDTWLYNTAIQFFLHFQINGWLLYAVIGILLTILERLNPTEYSLKLKNKNVLYVLDIGLWAGLAPLAYWVQPYNSFLILNVLSVLCLTYALGKIAFIIWRYSAQNLLIAKFIAILIIINILSHIISLWPDFLENLETNRNIIIAYLHLVLLGIVSLTFIFYSIWNGIIKNDAYTKTAVILWVIGFIFSETYLMLQGLFQINLPFHLEGIWFFSFIILVGISIIFIKILSQKKLSQSLKT